MTFISGNRDDLEPVHYEEWNVSNALRSIEKQVDFAGARRALDLTDLSTPDPESDVERMIGSIMSCKPGPILALDLTRPEIGIPVFKVLTPKLAIPSRTFSRLPT